MSLSVLRFCWFCIHSLFFVFFIYLFIYSSSLFLHFFYPSINALPLLKATTTFNAWCSLMEVVDFLASYTDFGFCYGYARNFPVSPLGYRLILVHIVWIFVTLREVVALNSLYFPFYFIYLFIFSSLMDLLNSSFAFTCSMMTVCIIAFSDDRSAFCGCCYIGTYYCCWY